MREMYQKEPKSFTASITNRPAEELTSYISRIEINNESQNIEQMLTAEGRDE